MGTTKGMKKTDVLSASEIGQYQYCSCAWMLRRCGYEPESPGLDEGKQMHASLGDAIDGFVTKTRYVRWAVLLGFLLLITAAALFFLEVIL